MRRAGLMAPGRVVGSGGAKDNTGRRRARRPASADDDWIELSFGACVYTAYLARGRVRRRGAVVRSKCPVMVSYLLAAMVRLDGVQLRASCLERGPWPLDCLRIYRGSGQDAVVMVLHAGGPA